MNRRTRSQIALTVALGMLTTIVVSITGVRPAAAFPDDVVTINDISAPEGTGGTPEETTFTFTVTVEAGEVAGSGGFTLEWSTADGTATGGAACDDPSDPGVDYIEVTNGQELVPVAAGSQEVELDVIVCADAFGETDETFFVDIEAAPPGSADVQDSRGQATIENDDGAPPSVSIGNAVATEGTDATAVFTATLSGPVGQPVTVDYTTVNGTATAGQDYTAESGTITFAANDTSETVDVAILDDSLDEANESFFVELSNARNATIADASGEGTITDDDERPTISIGDDSEAEGDTGTTDAVFEVTLSAESGRAVSVNYTTNAGTATADEDYTTTAGTLTFNPGETSKNILVPIIGDTAAEDDETFTVTLSDAANATIVDGTGDGLIIDDDDEPTLSINDVTVTEGDTGTVDAVFTVTKSGETDQTVTVDFATANDTATAGSDYTTTSGALTFAPGETSKTVTVSVAGDTTDETNERFFVNLSNATNATIADGQGIGTINDDDEPPTISINDPAAVAEGDAGDSGPLNFTVSLSQASEKTVTVNWVTNDNTATSPADYAAASGTVTFVPGDTEETVTVTINGDDSNEADETFFVDLSGAVNATIADGQGVGTITDDDPGPGVSIDDPSKAEGNSGTSILTFTVTLDSASGQTVTVDYSTRDGVARAGSDYVATSGTLTFNPGETSRTIGVTINGDTAVEPDENFFVDLSNPTGDAAITDGEGEGTITNDDGGTPASLAIDDVTMDEGDAGTTNFVFTVTRSGESSVAVTVDFATADGTATAGSDYTAQSGTLNFAAGDNEETITIAVQGDTRFEGDDTFTVELSNPSNATISDGSGLGTITNDDTQPTISIADSSVTEGDSGTSNLVFTVTLSHASDEEITVNWATSDDVGEAEAGSDYTAGSGTVTFAPGSTSETITVTVVGDVVDEDDETLTVTLSSPTNATMSGATATGTLTDDDVPAVRINNVAVDEGDTGTRNAVFTVTVEGDTEAGRDVTVDWATADGTADAPDDYTANGGMLTFTSGSSRSQTVTVLVQGDTLDENDETFVVNLSNASANATIADAQGTGVIRDDDASPTLTIDNVTVTEGDSGTVDATFTLTLSTASGREVTVDFATVDGTATSPADFTSLSGTATFAAGDTSETITVKVKGDTIDEANETFSVALSNASGASISDDTGVGTISDDDVPPAVSIDDIAVTEGDTGTTLGTFTVTLSAVSGKQVTVDFTTADGSAVAPGDYSPASGTVTFAAGQTSKPITVSVIGDSDEEPDETFTVVLSDATNASISDDTGAATITNDDDAQGYAIVGGDGGIFAFGDAEFHGSMGGQELNSPVISMAYTPTGDGYWLVAGDGGIFSFGDAEFFGSMGAQRLNAAVLGMEATPTGDGYWLFAADGGIFSFGDAEFFGSMGATPLNAPVVGMAAASTGEGYWLVAQDGGIFSFGEAPFHGSTGAMVLNEPVFDMASNADDSGYWLVARDGGIFNFGDAPFHGSAVSQNPTTVIGMGATPSGGGYWIADDRGAVFVFGDAQFFGDLRNVALNSPAVGFAALPE